MKQEDKELLLKDLSARLPYGTIVKSFIGCQGEDDLTIGFNHIINIYAYDCKPYLRPMISMTDEEREEYQKFLFPCPDYNGKVVIGVYHRDLDKVYDWLNAHHFDYRGLIERGLAIKVTPDNNPYE